MDAIFRITSDLPATTTKARMAAAMRSTAITTSQLSLRNGIRKVPHAMSLPWIVRASQIFILYKIHHQLSL